ncbi:hypothetical protein LG45_03325 [Flavobacterium aquatile LMG 4008 = ATCC 11947]|uniref:Uncharacterized protein n=1 Tax=Flavobacterium aquatile LMG 4008 = ATCC 11947 TaxID=1453498 RepID=A0A095SWG8_9FLAO|nr:hypothetical protein LG45_03325 [Flavobacterium aquatile LMG 4008 = ATCC 11947]
MTVKNKYFGNRIGIIINLVEKQIYKTINQTIGTKCYNNYKIINSFLQLFEIQQIILNLILG